MIDSHAHLNFRKLSKKLDEVMETAREAGVFTVANIGIDLDTSKESIKLAEKYPDIIATVGIHPNTKISDNELENSILEIEKLAKHPSVIAIGEIGLDYYRDHVYPQKQKIMFRKQLELASKLDMPISLHIRPSKENFHDVFDDFKKIFMEYPHLDGVLHAFAGDENFVKWTLENTKLYFGLGGPITFKNYKNYDAIRQMPMDRIVTETDCPFLAPHPYRGKTNEPAMITHIADRLSKFFRKPIDEIDSVTSNNAANLYSIGLPGTGQSQVFLKSKKSLEQIASIFDNIEKSPIALEIGAGQAVLTKKLCQRYEKVYAIEPDLGVYPLDFKDACVIPKSILDVNIPAISEYEGKKLAIFGNIPYHLTSDILFYLLKNIESIDCIALLVQKEVAKRLSARPGNRDYGIPTILLGNLFEISFRFSISARAFKPKPDVDSAVITMIPRESPIYKPKDYKLFEFIVQSAFGQRRKMMRKSLKGKIKNLPSRFAKKRPEELRIEDFGEIADMN
ncbi:MAG: YchF/TatD family DNA exonuclease [Candidatus Zixiibacteriota bacterium]